MIPWVEVDRTGTPDGTPLVLARRGDEWEVRAGRATLMTSRSHGSEEDLVRLAFAICPGARTALVGGLGLGYSLRAALDLLPPAGRVVVAELSEALVGWNRTHVAFLAGRPLDDPRAEIHQGDVRERIEGARETWDVVALDVDNGPSAFVQDANVRLYGPRGVAACHAALRPGGALTVWSLAPDEAYLRRLRQAGFEAAVRSVRARAGGGKRHFVFVAVKAPGPRPSGSRARRPRG